MEDAEIRQLFSSFYEDIVEGQDWSNPTQLLAHYTSMEGLERILSSQEVWFSNPLFMTDIEEVRFGLLEGVGEFRRSEELRAAMGSEARHNLLMQSLDGYIDEYARGHLFDTYVFCLSEHSPQDTDGLLSMWRGYGGNGRGAALVFDTAKLGGETPESALILAKVEYGSISERQEWLRGKAREAGRLSANAQIPDEKLYVMAFDIFQRLKLFALFSKHRGFSEEKEWRIVYMPERDTNNVLKPMLGYLNGPRGVEPKLKMKVQPISGMTSPGVTLSNLIHSIILGPTVSSELAYRSVSRMLELLGRAELKDRLRASSIPYRAD